MFTGMPVHESVGDVHRAAEAEHDTDFLAALVRPAQKSVKCVLFSGNFVQATRTFRNEILPTRFYIRSDIGT